MLFSVGSIREFLREYEKVSGSRVANFADVDLGLVRSKRDEITTNVDSRFRDEVERLIDMLISNEDVIRRALSLSDDVFNNVLRREFDFVLADLTGVPSDRPDYSRVPEYFPVSGSKGLESVIVFKPDNSEMERVIVDSSEFTIHPRWKVDASSTLRRVLSRTVSVSVDDMSVSLLGTTYRFRSPSVFSEVLRRLGRTSDYIEFMYRNVMSMLPDRLKGFEVKRLVSKHPITGEVDGFSIILSGKIDDLGISVPEEFSGGRVDLQFTSTVMFTTSTRLKVVVTSEKIGIRDLFVYSGKVSGKGDIESIIGELGGVLSNISDLLEHAKSKGYRVNISSYDYIFSRLPFILYKDNTSVTGSFDEDGIHARLVYTIDGKIHLIPEDIIPKLEKIGVRVYSWSVGVNTRGKKTYVTIQLDVNDLDELFSMIEKVVNGIRETVDDHLKQVRRVKRRRLSDTEILSLYLLLRMGAKINVEALTGRTPTYIDRRVRRIYEKIHDDQFNITSPLVKKNILSFDSQGNVTINGKKLVDILSKLGVDPSRKDVVEGIKDLSRLMIWEYETQNRLHELSKIKNPEFLSFVTSNSRIHPSFFANKVDGEYIWNIISSEVRKEYIREAGSSTLKWMAERPEIFREDYDEILNSLLRVDRNTGTEILLKKMPELIGVDKTMTLYREKEFKGIRTGDYIVQVIKIGSDASPSGDKTFLVFNAKEKIGFPIKGKRISSAVKYASSRWNTFKNEIKEIKKLADLDRRVSLSYYGDTFKVPVVEIEGRTRKTRYIVRPGVSKIVKEDLRMIDEGVDESVICSII